MGSARPRARRYREALMECAAAFSAIAAFSAGVTHTLTGVDSRRVFSFLASSIFNFPGGSRTSPEEQDSLVERGHARIKAKSDGGMQARGSEIVGLHHLSSLFVVSFVSSQRFPANFLRWLFDSYTIALPVHKRA